MVENDLYEHEKCWTIFDRVCLKMGLTCSQNNKCCFWENYCNVLQVWTTKIHILIKVFWPFSIFRPSSKIKVIPDLFESVFFGLKYLPHICGMDLNKPVQCSGLMGETRRKILINREMGSIETLGGFSLCHFFTF